MSLDPRKGIEQQYRSCIGLAEEEQPLHESLERTVNLRCHLHIYSTRSFPFCFPFRLQRIWENGMLDKIFAKHTMYSSVNKCSQRRIDHPTLTPISLYDLSSAFIVFAIGISLSVLAFLVVKFFAMWKFHTRQVIEV